MGACDVPVEIVKGADTVASYQGIGKASVIKVAKQRKGRLSEVGDTNKC